MVAKLLIDVPTAHWAYTVLLDPEREYTFGTARDNFFPLPPGSASPRHMMLACSDAWIVHDCGSETGTLVNGRRVQTHRLHDGDILRMGTCEAVFQCPREGADERERDSTHRILENQQSALVEAAARAQQGSPVDSSVLEQTLTFSANMQPLAPAAHSPSFCAAEAGDLAWAAAQLARIMSEVLSSPGSREETYRLILRHLRDAVAGDNGFVMIADHGKSRWVIRAWIGESSSWSDYEKRHPLPLTVTNKAYQTLSVVSNALVHDAEAEDSLNSRSMEALNVNGYIAVPLLREKLCRGVLYFDTRNPARRFRPRDARLLELAASCILGIEDQPK